MTRPAEKAASDLARRMRSVAVLVCVCIAMAAFCLVSITREIQANNRKWCGALTILHSAEGGHPPATATGRKLFADFERLRQEYGC